MRKIIILIASAALLSTGACNMMRGLGQDVEDTANAADAAV
jgi:predicted small secreted protein